MDIFVLYAQQRASEIITEKFAN